MRIVIGRDPGSGCLKVSVDGGKMQVIKGTQGLSPMVSKDHLMLDSDDGQDFLLTNLKSTNVTYVDHVPVIKYHVKRGAPVYMGVEKQPLDWKAIDQYIPKYIDIRPLEGVWNGYQQAQMNLQIQQQKSGTKRMMLPMFSICGSIGGGLIAQVFDVPEKYRLIVSALCMLPGLLMMFFFILKGNREAEFYPRERKRLLELFQDSYVCPNCHHSFGNQPFKILKTQPGCPKCKSRFKV